MVGGDLDLMRLQVAALYVHNADGRICRSNEPGDIPAPRVFLGRTHEGNIWRLRDDLAGDLARSLAALLAAEPVSDDRRRPAACHDQLRDLLATSGSVDSPYCGPAYAFMVPVRPDEDARLVDLERRAVLRPILDEWVDLPLPELRRIQPLAAVFDHGELAALCWSSRLTDQAAEAGIKTLPPFRGRGYAVRAARTWAAAVQRSGRMALYSTSWDNLASQAVAGKLGLHCYGVDLSFG